MLCRMPKVPFQRSSKKCTVVSKSGLSPKPVFSRAHHAPFADRRHGYRFVADSSSIQAALNQQFGSGAPQRPAPVEVKLKSEFCDSISCVKPHVYILKQDGTNTFKIGFSQTSVQARLKTLQTGNPKLLTIVAMFHGSQQDEQALHRVHKEHRQKGEWFAFPPGTCSLLS